MIELYVENLASNPEIHNFFNQSIHTVCINKLTHFNLVSTA